MDEFTSSISMPRPDERRSEFVDSRNAVRPPSGYEPQVQVTCTFREYVTRALDTAWKPNKSNSVADPKVAPKVSSWPTSFFRSEIAHRSIHSARRPNRNIPWARSCDGRSTRCRCVRRLAPSPRLQSHLSRRLRFDACCGHRLNQIDRASNHSPMQLTNLARARVGRHAEVHIDDVAQTPIGAWSLEAGDRVRRSIGKASHDSSNFTDAKLVVTSSASSKPRILQLSASPPKLWNLPLRDLMCAKTRMGYLLGQQWQCLIRYPLLGQLQPAAPAIAFASWIASALVHPMPMKNGGHPAGGVPIRGQLHFQ